MPLQVGKLMCHKLFEPLQVLSIQLYIVMSGSLHPERLNRTLTSFVQRQSVGEVDDLILCTMDH